MPCTRESHETLKQNREAFLAETTPNGVQYLEGKPAFEYRHHFCGSDLALVLDEDWYAEIGGGS